MLMENNFLYSHPIADSLGQRECIHILQMDPSGHSLSDLAKPKSKIRKLILDIEHQCVVLDGGSESEDDLFRFIFFYHFFEPQEPIFAQFIKDKVVSMVLPALFDDEDILRMLHQAEKFTISHLIGADVAKLILAQPSTLPASS